MVQHKTLNLNDLTPLSKHENKKKIKQLLENERNALLVLSRYDISLSKSVVDIVDLKNFEVIHTYRHDVAKMNNKIKNMDEFPRAEIDSSPTRFRYLHPLIFEDGSLISFSKDQPMFKIDFCSNLKWINDEEQFHHGQNLDHNGNIWVAGRMQPESKQVEKYKKKYGLKEYIDDAVIQITTDGEILFKKSIVEILIENNIVPDNFVLSTSLLSTIINQLHLNEIQPALSDSEYWKRGDLFISIRNQSAIIHYRPNTNKVINYITGPFIYQHDVDIISDKEISIFNNNNIIFNNKNFEINKKHSEVIIYDFETKNFRTLFKKQLKKENFITETNGLSEFLNDGSLMVEETIHGRLILFNNKGEKEWEFVNKDENDKIGRLFWSRIIEDELLIEKFKLLTENKKCIK